MKGTEEKLIGRNSQLQISERSGKLFHSENKKTRECCEREKDWRTKKNLLKEKFDCQK